MLVVVTKDEKIWRIMVKGQTLANEPVRLPLQRFNEGFLILTGMVTKNSLLLSTLTSVVFTFGSLSEEKAFGENAYRHKLIRHGSRCQRADGSYGARYRWKADTVRKWLSSLNLNRTNPARLWSGTDIAHQVVLA